ncbi:MAG: ATP-dependent helicase [Candidatus Doudnabacteria bacterium]|nr:ATP-dependent helicase [Candidatus Doudnabacteria bacterium]
MSQFLKDLNEEQEQAVKHVDGPLLIVAGAGTGKTTVITRRIGYILEQKLAKPDELLALTFTEKAATEMAERVDKLLPLGNVDPWISTFHSFCERILKAHALDIGLPNDFKLLDSTARWILVYKNFDKFTLDYYRPMGSPNRFIDALLSHFDKCKDETITPQEYLAYAESLDIKDTDPEEIDRLKEVANAYDTYQKLLIDNELLDFGDLISYCLQLFQKRSNILKFYQNKFKFIMVDEFQDTNYAQYQLVKLLAREGDTNPNLAVVGDDDQSIYKFRGASVSNILKFKQEFPKLSQITLTKNYRSCQNILDLAYDFITHNNPDRLEVELGINKKLKNPLTKKQGVIQVLRGQSLNEELDLVAKKIIEIKTAIPTSSWNDFAVLIRANSAADEVLPKLDSLGIPYHFVANKGLYKKPLIFDLLEYFKLLDNYHENLSLVKVMTLPKFRIIPQDLSTLKHVADMKTISLYEAISDPLVRGALSQTSQKKIESLLKCIHEHSELVNEKSAVELFIKIIEDLDIDKLLEPDTLENAELRELLEQFYKKVENFASSNSDRSFRAYMENLKLELKAGEEGSIQNDPNKGPELLKVMTVHTAKGLEFEYVFIVNLVDQRFPTRAKGETIALPEALIKDILPSGDFHLQEERRLFYVALTRAKSQVYLTWATDYGGTRAKKPSLFLEETGLVPGQKSDDPTGKVVFDKPKRLSKKIVFKTLPDNYSYSAIKSFLQCPLEYKYKYYLKIPMRGSYQMSFGITIHKAFEEFVKLYQAQSLAKKPLPDFKTLEKLYEDSWIDDWYENPKQKKQYKDKGYDILKTFYDKTLAQKPNVKYIEKFFKLELGAKKYCFVGKIDRADETPEGLAILDYKTGSAPKGKEAGDVDQLLIYQWACQDFLEEKVKSLSYWYLEGNEKKELEIADQNRLIELQDKLIETIEKINKTIKYDLFAEEHLKAKQHFCSMEGYN